MYFEKPGRENTQEVVRLVKDYIRTHDISHIIVASNTGHTAKLFSDTGKEIVCVTHVNGFRAPGEMEISPGELEELKKSNIRVLTTTHILSGAERGISRKFGGVYPVEIIAHTLRMFGQGVKVCVEVSAMALDSGLIPYGEKIIAVAGSGRGADTAIVVVPEHGQNIMDTWISEIICKPCNPK